MSTFPNQKLRSKRNKKVQSNSCLCAVCASSNCKESTDHQFISYDYLKQLAQKCKDNNYQIQMLKASVTQFYQFVHKKIKDYLQMECVKTLELLNQYYFDYLQELQQREKKILSQILENDHKSLPSKYVWKAVTILKRSLKERKVKNSQQINGEQISKIKRKFEQKNWSFDMSHIQTFLYTHIPKFSVLLEHQSLVTLSQMRSFKFIEQKTNEQDSFEWKNLKIRSIVKNVVLSGKKITDGQFLLNSQKLQKFTNINQFQARNNLLTHLSCSSIPFCLPNITSLDLRNNSIGDIGVQKLKGMSNLKQLMICHNQIGDLSARHILDGFKSLQVLWIHENNLTKIGALLLCEKPILKICSALGNHIQPSCHQTIKRLFAKKGLIYL